jgi:hypothetical protein
MRSLPPSFGPGGAQRNIGAHPGRPDKPRERGIPCPIRVHLLHLRFHFLPCRNRHAALAVVPYAKQDSMHQNAPALPVTVRVDPRCDRQDPTHQNAPAPPAAGRSGRPHGGQYPMQREAHRARAGRRAMPCLSRKGQCGMRQCKKESTQMQNGCTLMHADRPESGMVLHGKKSHDRAQGAAPGRWPMSHPRASACICVDSFLLVALRAARSRKATPPLRTRQNPIHLYGSSTCHRRRRHRSRPAIATATRRVPPNRPYAGVRWDNPMHHRTVRLTEQVRGPRTRTHQRCFLQVRLVRGWWARAHAPERPGAAHQSAGRPVPRRIRPHAPEPTHLRRLPRITPIRATAAKTPCTRTDRRRLPQIGSIRAVAGNTPCTRTHPGCPPSPSSRLPRAAHSPPAVP